VIRFRRAALSAAAITVGAVFLGVFGLAAPASAHVVVAPNSANQGGFGRLAFRVPTESDTASTTKVEITLPENAPVASVSTMPVPGWTVTMEKRKVDPPVNFRGTQVGEVVSKITWTATGDAAIKPGQFQEFPVQMGPLPAVDMMVFKALQTYSDGNVVRWIDEPPANGGEEPEHPAPVLKLMPAASPGPSGAASPAPAAAKGDIDRLAEWLGISGLAVGIGALLLSITALSRLRREDTPHEH
jgi:uncharacterized protein YcnI